MILRKLASAIRRQDWFTVLLEVVIVVLGVFIGIQVANWNDARRDREAEALYLDRLHREIAAISQRAEADYVAQHDRLERIEEVREFFATGTGIELLDGRHCGALSQSHIFADTIFYPPTIKELIATGRIVLIRDDAIRTAILSFDQTNEVLRQVRTDIQIDRQLLARTFPELIDLRLSEWEDAVCDFNAMTHDRAFLNDFIDNMRRYEAYVQNVTGRQAEVLQDLAATVEAGLTGSPSNGSARAGQIVPLPTAEKPK